MQNLIEDRQAAPSYELYIRGLIRLGWDRHWITCNEPALRRAYLNNPVPFPPPPEPVRVVDRYDEI